MIQHSPREEVRRSQSDQYSVEDIAARIPLLNTKPHTISPLNGGITNRNFRIDTESDSYVLRIAGEKTQLLGINRQNEYVCAEIAAAIGVGPRIVHFVPETGSIMSQFLRGTTLSAEQASTPDVLKRIVASIKTYHAGPEFPCFFSPFNTVREYHALALQHGVAFPESISLAFTLMDQIEKSLGPLKNPHPCHNDLLAGNFMDDGSKIWIVDWEYAGMGDPYFDLGNFAVNQKLTPDQCRLLLLEYTGKVEAKDLARLNLMRLVSDLREAFWGFLQSGISNLEFDYKGYASEHLQRFLVNGTKPECQMWLNEVAL